MSGSETNAADRSHTELISELKSLSRKEIKQLFRTLPVPDVSEFHGEFQGILLNQGNALTTATTRFFVNKEGYWLGKAFEPVTEDMGRGYNIFRTRHGIRRCLRMHIRLREAEDGQKRLAIEYDALNDGLVGRIYDDMRRLAPGVFLGIGTVPLGGALFPKLRRKVTFCMAGPVAEFRTDAAEHDVLDADEWAGNAAA